MIPPERAQGRIGIFPEGIAGALAYLSFLPAIVFLLVEPYRRNRFVRFHSVQCLALWIAAIVFGIVLRLVGMLLFIIPVLGPLLVYLIDMVAILGAFVIWLVLVVKALQGESFKIPVLGDYAEQQSFGNTIPPAS
jgi:uncharacterized membrane protein